MKKNLQDIGGIIFDAFITIVIGIVVLNILGSILVSTAFAAEQPLTKDEQTVALTLLGEARGEKQAGLYAVGCVIQKRSLERKLTPAQVCLQPKQFSCWNDRKYMDTMRRLLEANTEQAKYAKLLARSICKGDRLVQSFTGEANHYHATYVTPYWSKKFKPTKRIGNHIFYKLP